MGSLKRSVAVAWGIALLWSGCRASDAPVSAETETGETVLLKPEPEPSGTIVVADLFASVASCDVYHRGFFQDLGSQAAHGRLGYEVSPFATVQNVVRDGAVLARVDGSLLSVGFRQERTEPVFVETRIRGLDSRSASVRIDGKEIGTIRLQREQTQVVSTPTTPAPLSAGQHVVSLHFRGNRRGSPAAEIDWIRVGVPDQDPTTFSAPTLRDLATNTTIGGRPHRTLTLRAPGKVRCAVAVAESMTLHTTIGYSGAGEGEASVEVAVPGSGFGAEVGAEVGAELGAELGGQSATHVLHTANFGDEAGNAEAVEIPLDHLAGRVVAIDLVASKASPGGWVLFGDPVLRIRNPRIPERSQAKVVVIVVLTGAAPSQLPGYTNVPTMPFVSSLLEESVVFRQHRAPTTVAAGSMASLLTGLSPVFHKVTDTGARLGERFQTLGSIARDGRAVAGMFTGNPATFETFGFDRGWTRYASFSPVSGTSADAPLREANAWLDSALKKDKKRPLLVVVHARAGHPPWTGTDADFENLPPADYAGNITARRGGQVLAQERNRRFGNRPMPQEDRVRVEAFARNGLKADDALMGQLGETLKYHGVWASTLFVVTSDIAIGGPGRVPFGDGESLGEDVLSIPLIVRFPDRRFAGTRVYVATNAMDVTRTVVFSMGLAPPDQSEGRDLLEVAAHPGRFGMEPQFAVTGANYSTRWGNWNLSGVPPRAPKFCEIAADGECGEDITLREPFFAAWAWRLTREQLWRSNEMLPRPSREPATLDAETSAALAVWGSIEPEGERK